MGLLVRSFAFIGVLLSSLFGIPNSEAQVVSTLTQSDSTAYGTYHLYAIDGWQFSFQKPTEIKDGRNLSHTIPADLNDLRPLKKDPRWNDYGWFELEVHIDSSLSHLPLILTYKNMEALKVWLNGALILTAGNPSKSYKEERLARFINPNRVGFTLQEGTNYFLVEYSEHTSPTYLRSRQYMEHGIYLAFFKTTEPFLRRHRAFIFGGALMLLLLVMLIQSFLALRFNGQYHTYVTLTVFFMLMLAFTTLSDTLINWSYSYIYFFEYSYCISLVSAAFFFLTSVRKIFDLKIAWRTTISISVLFILMSITSLYINRNWLNILHPLLLTSTLLYGFYSLWESKKKNPDANIWIIFGGIIASLLGSILYTFFYFAFGVHNHTLFITSVVLTFVGIPISLTFHVASNYANLITTLETKVQERTAALESAGEYQKRFLANISHEFRTPLTIGGGLIDKMMKEEERGDSTSMNYNLSIVKRNMLRLQDMVNQIIDLTKSDQKQLTLHKRHFLADNLVTLSVESFRSLAEYQGHAFMFEANAEGAVLFVDRSKVEIIINNLISNAVKFTPEGGSINITTKQCDHTFQLFVQDTGLGIPVGEEEAVFERFYRLQRQEHEYVEGMGVGLELSRTLARLHGGDVSVVTGLKIGACFKFELPIEHQTQQDVVPIIDTLSEEMMLHKPKYNPVTKASSFDLLLVEDNDDMMTYVHDTLSDLGNIKKAKNGREALHLLKTYIPDIIITDLMMPVMGGQELVTKLFEHEKWREIPTIVLTAKALEEDKLNLLRIGVVDYITKPFLPEQLVLKTKNLLTYYTRRKKLKLSITADEAQAESDFLHRATTFVSKNISNSSLSVDLLADEFLQSRRTFYRNLQLETGMTPAEFIREIRLTMAQSMVAANKNLRLEELANALGYKSATSFRRIFEERFGKHPLR